MKVLLYEPVTGGHHGVVLLYMRRILDTCHITHITIARQLHGDEYAGLQVLAHQEQCDLIHVMFVDSSVRNWINYSFSCHRRVVPVIGNYYMYNDLYRPLRRWALWWLFRRGLVEKLLISDDYWMSRPYLSRIRSSIRFVPDPWLKAEFPAWTMEAARARLGIPGNKRVLLVFGKLCRRKGVEGLVQAYLDSADPNVDLLLLVGEVDDDLRNPQFRANLQSGLGNGSIQLVEGFVEELLVSAYFYACDVVAIAYPAAFQISSGIFTRACAAGRPVLASDTGVTGRLVRENNMGYTFPADDYEKMKKTIWIIMEAAPRMRADRLFQASARRLAQEREFAAYLQSVIVVYDEMRTVCAI